VFFLPLKNDIVNIQGAENAEAAQRFNRSLGYPLLFLRVLCASAVKILSNIEQSLKTGDISATRNNRILIY